MKNTGKAFWAAALAVLLAFSMSSCDMGSSGSNNEIQYGPTIFYDVLTFGSGQQIWTYHPEWERVSEAYSLFTEDREVVVFVSIFDDYNQITGEEEVGSGTIRGGILNFRVETPEAEVLFGWEALKSRNFFYWEDAAIDVEGVRGNEFKFRTTDNKRLNLELITGDRESVSQEIVRFIYVDRPSRITGSADSEGIIAGAGGQTPSYFYTENDLDLFLGRGWNTLYRRQTFYTDERGDGRSGITLLIKNPLNFKWVLYPAGFDGNDRDDDDDEQDEEE